MAITGAQLEGAFIAVGPTVDGSSVANRAADVLRSAQAITIRVSPPILVNDNATAATAVAGSNSTVFFRTDRAIVPLAVQIGGVTAVTANDANYAQFIIESIADDGSTVATLATVDTRTTATGGTASSGNIAANGGCVLIPVGAVTAPAGVRIRCRVAKQGTGVALTGATGTVGLSINMVYKEV
jgi:hypothetical protein